MSNPPAVASPHSSVLIAICWMAFAMSCIALVDALAKYLARDLHGVQIAWSYFVAMLLNLIVYLAIANRGRPAAFRALFTSKRRRHQIARAACLVLSLSCLFVGLQYLGLAEATVISFTSPLFVVALAGPFLGERVPLARWIAVLMGLIGALVVTRPGTEVFQWAGLLPLAGAVFFAFFHMITRAIGEHDAAETTLFHTFAGGALLSSLALPFVWLPMTPTMIGLALLSGTLGLLAHRSLVRSLTLANASVLAPLNYVRLVWAIGLGYVAFGEVPDFPTIIGGLIIIASGLYVVYTARDD